MSKTGEGEHEIPPPSKGDGSGGKITPVGGSSKDLCGVTLLRAEATQAPKEDWQTQEETQRLLHQMKRPMLHPKKKSKTRKEGREIRDPTTLLLLIMIIYLTLAPSLWYLLVTPPPPPFRWDGLYQMEVLDVDASILAQSEHLGYCAYMC